MDKKAKEKRNKRPEWYHDSGTTEGKQQGLTHISSIASLSCQSSTNTANQVLRSLAAISWRGITNPSYWAGQGLLVWIHQRHSLRDVGSRLIDTHQTSAAGLPSNNLLPGSAASNWWPHFFPLNPSTALPPTLTLSLSSSLFLRTSLLSIVCYTQANKLDRSVCVNMHTFSSSSLCSYRWPLTLRWWRQTFSIWRATPDGVWWQIWEASGGSLWLCDEKSAVIQEPSVIPPSKEHGLHPPGFKPLPAHTAMEEWQFLAMSVFHLSFSFCISLKLSRSLTMPVLLSFLNCLLTVTYSRCSNS